MKEEGEEVGDEGVVVKGVPLQTTPATYRYPGIMGGLQRREDWNSALPEIRPDQN